MLEGLRSRVDEELRGRLLEERRRLGYPTEGKLYRKFILKAVRGRPGRNRPPTRHEDES